MIMKYPFSKSVRTGFKPSVDASSQVSRPGAKVRSMQVRPMRATTISPMLKLHLLSLPRHNLLLNRLLPRNLKMLRAKSILLFLEISNPPLFIFMIQQRISLLSGWQWLQRISPLWVR
jgi:hypothetical protein